MISFSEFKIGDKLEIFIQLNNIDMKLKPLISQLEDMKDDLLFISIPLVGGEPYRFKGGSKIKVIIYREEKGIYSFTGEIVSMVQKNIIMYGVKPISEIEKEQRRYFYRLQNRSKITIKSKERDLEETCYTKDLSGGGAKIACKSEFNRNEKVRCAVNLEGDIVNINGEIVRNERNHVEKLYELGIRFIEMSDMDRNKIVSYIFKEQRILRKKGLI